MSQPLVLIAMLHLGAGGEIDILWWATHRLHSWDLQSEWLHVLDFGSRYVPPLQAPVAGVELHPYAPTDRLAEVSSSVHLRHLTDEYRGAPRAVPPARDRALRSETTSGPNSKKPTSICCPKGMSNPSSQTIGSVAIF